ncbi:hypothetical protein Fmac_008539 [Flemingia macrophylla]|uniref:Tetraspanin-11 n=1 Tax=Flemingia macrophylla TaxID=520843 RepID=A0ABD1MXR6_9FABA
MLRINNRRVGILQALPMMVGLGAMGGALYIGVHGGCDKVLQYPLLFGGLMVSVVSTLGLLGALCSLTAALYLYLLLAFFLLLAFASFTVAALFVSARPYHAPHLGFRVRDFSPFLQHYVTHPSHWHDTRRCLLAARICLGLTLHANNDSRIFQHWSSTQYGCCKPPVQCGFTLMKNSTFWDVPKVGPSMNDSDCMAWNNSEDKLCYDCDSCKGGVLANIRKQWRHLTIFNICVIVLVTTVYILGCYAIRNNRLDYSNYKSQRRIRIPSTVMHH